MGINIAAAGHLDAAHKKSDAGSRCPAVLTSRVRAAKRFGALGIPW
jgi:hypothetical protein